MQQERPGAPLPFEACENFRELGGYTGCGGRHVKYGAFYRSPALANIKTPADRARFEALGVRTVFDFRSEKERTLAPDPDFRAGQTPILFHCTAGKDRTGVAAALILKALGVSREDIVEDYLLTNACRTTGQDQFRGMLERAGLPAAQAQQVTEIATGVRRESIESALDAIEEKYPSFEEYLRAEFEIGAAELEDIRARYLV